MTNLTTSHENITPEMKAANHAICTLASAMRDCEHCPFKPVQPAKATKPARQGDYALATRPSGKRREDRTDVLIS